MKNKYLIFHGDKFNKKNSIYYLSDSLPKNNLSIEKINSNLNNLNPNVNLEKNSIKKEVDYLKKKTFEEIVVLLNNHFHHEYPQRFWKILIGPWFNIAFNTYYNKCKQVFTLKSKINFEKTVFYLNEEKTNIGCKNTSEFVNKIDDYQWNCQVYMKIFRNMGLNYNKYIHKNKINNKKNKINNSLKDKLNTLLFYKVKFGNKLIVNTTLNKFNETFLQLALGHPPLFNLPDFFNNLETTEKKKNEIRLKLYEQFVSDNSDSNQTKIIKKLLIETLPSIFIENFEFCKKKIIESNFLNRIKYILTSQHFNTNEYFKFLAAFSILKGCKLYYLQHGNVDCVSKYDDYYNHVETPDLYLSYGWSDDDYHKSFNNEGKIYKFFNLKSSQQKQFTKKYTFEKKIIFFSAALESYRHYWNVSCENKLIFENQFKFLKTLEEKFYPLITCKLHPAEKFYYSEFKKETLKINEKIKISEKHIQSHKLKNILSVYSYDSSGLYEHLCINKPVIVFINQYENDINDFAKKYYNELKHAKILHDSPHEAAKFINSNWNNLEDWWFSDSTQKSITEFRNKLAKYSKKPVNELIKFIKTHHN